MSDMKYNRVMIKISGETLAGESKQGIDVEFVNWLAKEVKKVADEGIEVAITVGGGNFIRGATFAGHGIEAATADYMGMLATVINGQALMDVLQHNGQHTRVMSSLHMEQVAEPFIRRKAVRHMQKGRVVIMAGGIGRPSMTTDTAAVSLALELNCDVVMKATKVDGVYDMDPMQHNHATKYEHLRFQKVMEQPEIKVMDKAALGLAMEHEMPIIVFSLHDENNILQAATGKAIGTRISAK